MRALSEKTVAKSPSVAPVATSPGGLVNVSAGTDAKVPAVSFSFPPGPLSDAFHAAPKELKDAFTMTLIQNNVLAAHNAQLVAQNNTLLTEGARYGEMKRAHDALAAKLAKLAGLEQAMEALKAENARLQAENERLSKLVAAHESAIAILMKDREDSRQQKEDTKLSNLAADLGTTPLFPLPGHLVPRVFICCFCVFASQ